jgi:cytochrome c-type biogenesis protein CcmH
LLVPLFAGPAHAVLPDEILDDPVLEARAREITKDLRCVVCRNENVDMSDADVARDIRLMVRERLVAGDTNGEAIQYMVDRFGEFILLNPRASGSNLVLWLAAPLLLLAGLGIAVMALRQRRAANAPLTAEEEARLQQILDD